MNKTKLLAVAAGFLAAAGIASSGQIFVNGDKVGDYSDIKINGNGTVQITSSNFSGGSSGSECTLDQDSTVEGCQEAPWDACEHQPTGTTDYDPTTPGCQEPPTSGTGGDGGTSTPANCENVGTVSSIWKQDTSKTVFSTFPLPSGNWEKFTIPRNEYQAIKFTTNSSDKGKVSFDRHTHAEDTTKTIAITECPGDFSNTLPSSLCRRTSQATAIYFNTQSPFSSWECALEPNRDYYLNIAYGKGTGNNLENTCTETKCGAIYAFYH